MNRNASVSPLLRLPPELRARICKLVLGGQKLGIGYAPSKIPFTSLRNQCRLIPHRRRQHFGGGFYHLNEVDGSRKEIHLGLLRLRRQVCTETALLPYALNQVFFEDDTVRKEFEKSARLGKKRVQKQAIGKYELRGWEDFLYMGDP